MEARNRKLKYAVVSIDVIVVDKDGRMLFARRAKEKGKGKWAFIGTYVPAQSDNLEMLAVSQVKKETGLEVKLTHLVDALDDLWLEHPNADGKVRVVQILYRAEVMGGALKKTEHSDAYVWTDGKAPRFHRLAFNHKKLLSNYLNKLREHKLIPIARTVLSEHFGENFPYVLEEYVYFVAKALILNERQEILMGRRVQEPFRGHWDLPGGRMKMAESIQECLHRELEEELGVSCTIGDLFHIYSDKGKSPKYPGVLALYFGKINSSIFRKNVEMDEFAYFPLDSLPKEIAFHIDAPLLDLACRLATGK